jgi:cell division protein FtsI (penicillin-binding protein 3)
VLGAAFSLGFLALIGWLVAIQLRRGDALSRLAVRQQTRGVPIQAFRGPVLDRRGRSMATTIPAWSVYADPKLILKTRSPHWRVGPADGDPTASFVANDYGTSPAAQRLATALGLEPETIEEAIDRNAQRRFVWLRRRVDRPTRDAVDALRIPTKTRRGIRQRPIFGMGIKADGRRRYPNGSLASHVLGTVGSELQGTRGLEFLFNERLSGTAGHRLVRVDGHRDRRPVWISPGDYHPAVDGQLLVLTLDLTIQMFVEEALQETVEHFKAKGASAVVMDPRTGDVLALANYPTFDPQRPEGAEKYDLRNRVLTDPYEPGSTFKAIIASAALDEGVVRRGEKIFCHNGTHTINGRTLRDVTPRDWLPFELIVAKSSNIGMSIIGERMGAERLHRSMIRFGFGQPTGILLPGESGGDVKDLSDWSAWSRTSVPMGYEVLVTPLQMVTAFSAIANGGTLLKPRIIRYAYSPDRRCVADLSEPVVVRRVLRQETADYMRRKVLRRVITEGTGRKANIPWVKVFGKTGTAHKTSPRGGYDDDRIFGSFIGAAPLENPRVVVMVVVDEPDRSIGRYGGTVSAPAVRRILEKTLAYLGASSDAPVQLARDAADPAQ